MLLGGGGCAVIVGCNESVEHGHGSGGDEV